MDRVEVLCGVIYVCVYAITDCCVCVCVCKTAGWLLLERRNAAYAVPL